MNKPTKYRKKPGVIEAIQWTGILTRAVYEFLEGKRNTFIVPSGENFYTDHGRVRGGLIIKTLEGEHIARIDDYLIKGVNGEFYPCNPDIFEKTYELARGEQDLVKEHEDLSDKLVELCDYIASKECESLTAVERLLLSEQVKHAQNLQTVLEARISLNGIKGVGVNECIESFGVKYVVCMRPNCDAHQTNYHDKPVDAFQKWNQRKTEDQLLQKIQELESRLKPIQEVYEEHEMHEKWFLKQEFNELEEFETDFVLNMYKAIKKAVE